MLSVWPWDLLIVIAKHVRTGNCRRLNGIIVSEGIRGIRGRKTCSPSYCPTAIVASITLARSCRTISLVPLQSLGGSRFLRSIIGAPIFKVRI